MRKKKWKMPDWSTVGVVVGVSTFLTIVGVGLGSLIWSVWSGSLALTPNDVGLLIAFVAIGIREGWKARPKDGAGRWTRIASFVFLWFAYVIASIGVLAAAKYFWPAAKDFLGSAPVRGMGVPLVAAAGGLLYAMRRRMRCTYGFVEVIFALGVAWRLLPDQTWGQTKLGDIQMAAIISGCVYLIVRALDNMEQGFKSDDAIKWFVRWRAKRASTRSGKRKQHA